MPTEAMDEASRPENPGKTKHQPIDQHSPSADPSQKRDNPEDVAKATPAYGTALVVSLVISLAAGVGTAFRAGMSGVLSAALAFVVFLALMAATLLFNIASEPVVRAQLGPWAKRMIIAYSMLAYAIAILFTVAVCTGFPPKLYDVVIPPVPPGPSGPSGDMTATVYDLYIKGVDAFNKANQADESIRRFTEAISKDSTNYVLYANRAQV
jgi:hypothetical protein